MKTTFLTTAIVIASIFGISKSSAAATAGNETSTVLSEVTSINKIEVHGNVELYLSDGASDKVKVYNSYYAESALIQDRDGVLRISSYKAEKLVVWVTVNDLRNLALFDNATVKSFGKLSAIDLAVELNNNASAQLNMDAYTASISLNDHAKADLAGDIINGSIRYDKSAYLNTTKLVASNLIKKQNILQENTDDLLELVSL